MRADLTLPFSTLLAFALVLARIGGAFAFVPLPVKEAGPGSARIVLAMAVAVALFPVWPQIRSDDASLGLFAWWLLSEAALGVTIGVAVSFLSEALTFGAHVLALQAGFGYASIVDPTTQADSDVLPVMAQLVAGLFFFSMGFHRLVISAFAYSLTKYPPGAYKITGDIAGAIIQLSGSLFAVGVRLALPVVALLFMTELALALLGRVNSQLHASSHSFPIKIMVTLVMLATVLTVAPDLYRSYGEQIFKVITNSILH
ncbi:MAG: flagellar biosynthetic protein FliR [Acidobacteriaceae bacterium]|nr:flagellar biosynthetic protein FliR [Acidobacteriaceae bacterium]